MLRDLYSLRKARGFTQRSLAAASGVSYSTINNIENGKAIPTLYTVALLARALEMTPAELAGVLTDGEEWIVATGKDYPEQLRIEGVTRNL